MMQSQRWFTLRTAAHAGFRPGIAALLELRRGELKSIAAIVDRPVIEKILAHLGLDQQSPCTGLAHEGGQD